MVANGVRARLRRGVDRYAGWLERMPRRLGEQFVKEREFSRDKQLAAGELRLPPTQDWRQLVKMGYRISPAFFVPKEKQKTCGPEYEALSMEERMDRLRMVFNLKRLNTEHVKKKCKYEGVGTLRKISKKGTHTHALTGDVKQGFKCLEFYPEDQMFFCADLGPQVSGPRFVVCVAMCFGWTNSPYYFNVVMKDVMGQVRSGQFESDVVGKVRSGKFERKKFGPPTPITIWVDDYLALTEGEADGDRRQKMIEEIFKFNGVPLHPTKGHRRAVQRIEKHLGTGVDLKQGHFFTPITTMAQMRRGAKQILRSLARHHRWIGARWIAEYGGLCISTMESNSRARFLCRPMSEFLAQCDVYRNGYGVRGKASRRLIRCLEQWSRIGEEREVRRTLWLHPTTKTCATDASSWAGGGLGNARPLDQQPLGQQMGVPMMHIWNEEEKKLHITAKELKAFRQYLGLHAASYRNCGLLAWQDNQGVVGIMKKLSVKSKDPATQLAMEADLEAIMDLLDKWDIHLKMRYIESARNPADYFTRYAEKGDWQLEPVIARRLMKRWTPCTVDRFADAANAQLPRFNSGYPARGTEAVDTFTADWTGECNWVNPPWCQMAAALSKLDHTPECAAVVLAPVWPTAIWWPTLQRLAVDSVAVHAPASGVPSLDSQLSLPDESFIPGAILRQVGGTPEPLRNRGWRLRAYFIPFRKR